MKNDKKDSNIKSSEFASIQATQILEDVVNKSLIDKIPIKDLIDAMNFVGFGLVMMIFSFAVLIPLPPPVPSIMGTPLLFFAAQMLAGLKAPYLPKRLSKVAIKRSILMTLAQKSAPYISRVERLLVPRMFFMFNPIFERITGFFILIFSLSICLPLPLSNFIPGVGILIISFGLLSKDGLVVLIGNLVGIVGVVVTVTAFLAGFEFLHHLKTIIFG